MKSVLVPDFASRYSGILKSVTAILDYHYFHPSHAPWEMGPGIVLTVYSYDNCQVKLNIEKPTYMHQSFSKTDARTMSK